MEREEFVKHFRRAAVAARDFARSYIEEPLPDAMCFRLKLNCSHDAPLVEGEVVYPEDSTPERAKELTHCDEEAVIQELWRDGKVPEWVNISVVNENGAATILEVASCGRFTEREELLYYDGQPFHVVGPSRPGGDEGGKKFSIHRDARCLSTEDLEYVRAHAATLCSLSLEGGCFDDAVLAELPALSRLQSLRIESCLVRGPGLQILSSLPQLRALTIELRDDTSFSFPPFPAPLSALTSLDVKNLPSSRDVEWRHVWSAAPDLCWLRLHSRGDLLLGGELPDSAISIRLEAARLGVMPRLPAKLETLALHLSQAGDAELAPLFAELSQLKRLVVCGTPVSEALLEPLLARFGLEVLNVTNSGVSDDALERIRAEYPEMKTLPRIIRDDEIAVIQGPPATRAP